MSKIDNLQNTAVPVSAADGALPAPGVAGAIAKVGRYRWNICALLFFCTAVNYLDRGVIGILKPMLSHQLGWTEQGYALIVMCFQFTYAFGYLFGGVLMDAIGVKRGLPGAALIWSIAEAAHGLVRTVAGFSIARGALGIAEGVNFPAAIRTVGEWYPVKERALATGLFNSASNIGAIVCPLLVPWLAVTFGWQMAFFITGGLGVIWVIAWTFFYDTPQLSRRITPAERAYIEGDRLPSERKASEAADGARPRRPESTTGAPVAGAPQSTWINLLMSRPALAYIVATALTGPVWWFYLFWMPDFLSKRFHLTETQLATPVASIYIISIAGSIGAGWLAGWLIERGRSVDFARKVSLLICALCVVPVFTAPIVPGVWAAVAVVGLAAAAHQGWSANLYTFASDTMGKKATGSLVGLGGFASGLLGGGTAWAVGKVLTVTHSYWSLFIVASGMYIVSVIIIQLLVPRIQPMTGDAA